MIPKEIKKGYKEIGDHIEKRYILNPLIKKEEKRKGRKLTKEELEELSKESKIIRKMNKSERDILRRFSGKSIEEIRKLQEVDDINEYDRLRYAYTRVKILLDFISLINSHKSELKYPAIRIMGDLGHFNAGQNLGPYIILDIVSFYELLDRIEEKIRKRLPPKPNYFDKIKRFRNKIVGHIDEHKELKDISDWFNEYEEINKIGLDRIVGEFEKNFKVSMKILSEYEKQ